MSKLQIARIRKSKVGGGYAGPIVTAQIEGCYGKSRLFPMRLDTGADISIVPEWAADEAGLNLYRKPIDLSTCLGELTEGVGVHNCLIFIEGFEAPIEPPRGVVIAEKLESGLLGAEILEDLIAIIVEGEGFLIRR